MVHFRKREGIASSVYTSNCKYISDEPSTVSDIPLKLIRESSGGKHCVSVFSDNNEKLNVIPHASEWWQDSIKDLEWHTNPVSEQVRLLESCFVLLLFFFFFGPHDPAVSWTRELCFASWDCSSMGLDLSGAEMYIAQWADAPATEEVYALQRFTNPHNFVRLIILKKSWFV